MHPNIDVFLMVFLVPPKTSRELRGGGGAEVWNTNEISISIGTRSAYELTLGMCAGHRRGVRVRAARVRRAGVQHRSTHLSTPEPAKVAVWRRRLPDAELWEAEYDAACVDGGATQAGQPGGIRDLLLSRRAGRRDGVRERRGHDRR